MAVRHQINLANLISTNNPCIDLNIKVYDTSTRNFLNAVSKYRERTIAMLSERRNNHTAEKKRIAERAHAVEVETNTCKLKEIELVADLEKETAERKDAEASVAAFKRRLASLRERCAAVDAEIEQYRATVANLRREKHKEHSTLNRHVQRVSPEISNSEYALACIVEGIEQKERLLVRFFKVDEADPEREFGFVLDISSDSNYKIQLSSPALPSLPVLVDDLNQDMDIYRFIHRVRQDYRKLVLGI